MMDCKDARKGFHHHKVQQEQTQGSAPGLGQSPESEQTGRWNGNSLAEKEVGITGR